jgi:hypothetical protein
MVKVLYFYMLQDNSGNIKVDYLFALFNNQDWKL